MHLGTWEGEETGRHSAVDDATDRRAANRAVGVSAVGQAITGVVELLLALVTGSVGLLGDAFHNLSDVSTSAVVFAGFRISKRRANPAFPHGFERAEVLAGLGVAFVIWASAVFAGVESVRKLVSHGSTSHVGIGMLGALLGILGNQLVARYKLRVGRRIQSATLVSDAKHSWLDALSSLGALLGLIGVGLGYRWADPVAGFVITAFIVHVGIEVTGDLLRQLMDGVDADIVPAAETAAGAVFGVWHAYARARWTGRTLRIDVDGWVPGSMSVTDAEILGHAVTAAVHDAVPKARRVHWTPLPAPDQAA